MLPLVQSRRKEVRVHLPLSHLHSKTAPPSSFQLIKPQQASRRSSSEAEEQKSCFWSSGMELSSTFVLVGLVLLLLLLVRWRRKPQNLPPGPAALPLLGHIFKMDNRAPFKTFLKVRPAPPQNACMLSLLRRYRSCLFGNKGLN